MPDRKHLSVVRTPEEDNVATEAALRQIASRVPSRLQRVYDWTSPEADALFESLNTPVAEGRVLMNDMEDMLDMPGLVVAYLNWVGRQ